MAEREDAVQGAWEMKKSKWESRLKMVESDRTNGTNTSVSQMHPYVPASTDHRLFIPSHTRRPRSIHSPVSSLFLILKLLSTALLNNSMCCVEHVFESGCFDDFRKSFKISSCKRLFGFQTSESCTATARWPADTNAELAVYCLCKKTEETIPRKLLAFVHLHFRVMFRRSNKECHLVFSMKYLLFQGRFG